MPHVMVPVPVEHLPEFTQTLLRISLGMAGWEAGSVTEFIASLEPRARTLVDEVAAVSADHGRLSFRQAAHALGTDVAEVLDLVTDLNERCRRASLPYLLITESQVDPGDETSKATPVLVIVQPVALLVLEAAAATEEA